MSDVQTDPVVLELRVHGVRGTTTESMLGVKPGEVEQVAGDQVTGFYRIAENRNPPLREPGPNVAVEAYSWGALTSGVRGLFGWVNRVLWLSLLPFALVNMSFWARCHVGEMTSRARSGLRAVRVSGLLLTIIGVLTPCLIAIDLVGWQCFRRNSIVCPVLPDWTDQLASLSTGQRLAITSLVPLFVVALLVALSARTLARYEATKLKNDQPMNLAKATNVGVLGHQQMWSGEDRTRRLQRLHVAAALSTVVCYTGFHLVDLGQRGLVVGTSAAAAVILAVALGLAFAVDPMDLEYDPKGWRLFKSDHSKWHDLLALAAAAILVAHLLALWQVRVPLELHDRNFYGSNIWFIAVFVLLTVMQVVLFVGGRLPTWLAAGVVGGMAILVLFGVTQAKGGAGLATSAALAAAALGVWLVLLVIQFCYAKFGSVQLRSTAWAGSGSSVLLGAAIMTALLFTTATVVATANHLNGPTQSVDDLITRRPTALPLNQETFFADGPVQVNGARITSDAGVFTISSGEIVVESLATTDSDSRLAKIGLGSTHLRHGTLVLGPVIESISLASSCFGREGDDDYASKAPCTGESTGFRTAGALTVLPLCRVGIADQRCLQIKSTGSRVSIEVTKPPQAPLVLPQVLVWTPIMEFTALLLIGLLLVIGVGVFYRLAAPKIRSDVDRDASVPAADKKAVARARVGAALAHRPERFLGLIGLVISLLALPMLALSINGRPPWDVFEWLRPWSTFSLYAVVLASLALVFAGAQIRRSAEVRRSVGILWDITTFWPRAGHPFGPPCYAERVVPEVTARVRWALDSDPKAVVVLSGHSQGSLICAAVLCRLSGVEHRVRLITYGSQIRAIYGRVFPRAAGPVEFGYAPTVGPIALSRAEPDLRTEPMIDAPPGGGLRSKLAAVDHWVNLFRRGDPLGYRVFSDLDDPVLDQPTLEVPTAQWGDPGPRVLGHGSYQHSPQYRAAIAKWTNEPVLGPPTEVTKVPALPPT